MLGGGPKKRGAALGGLSTLRHGLIHIEPSLPDEVAYQSLIWNPLVLYLYISFLMW